MWGQNWRTEDHFSNDRTVIRRCVETTELCDCYLDCDGINSRLGDSPWASPKDSARLRGSHCSNKGPATTIENAEDGREQEVPGQATKATHTQRGILEDNATLVGRSFIDCIEDRWKISEFKATQTTIASLLEAPVAVELVDIARECVDQIDNNLIELKTSLVQFTTKVKEILKTPKTSASGSWMSHKWVLGAYWSSGLQLWEAAQF